MEWFKKGSIFFKLGMVGIFLLSLILRFWGLTRFDTLVFDEVYFAKFAHNYFTETSFFNSHPPLSQYLIAVAMKIASVFPWNNQAVNPGSSFPFSPGSYRWMNAVIGSFIPGLVGAIAYQLTSRYSLALLVSGLMAMDGLFLVESRYALNNIYIIFFGLIAQLFFLMALKLNKSDRWIYLIISGVAFGATIAVKWNGLGFLLGIYLLLACAWFAKFKLTHLPKLAKYLCSLTPVQILLSLVIIPALTYSILWIPHLQQNPEYGLWSIHQKMLTYHQNLGNGSHIHPYCSPWYTWPLMIRPMVYFFQRVDSINNIDPSLSNIDIVQVPVIYDIHGMGNPILWWFSTLTILGIIGLLLWQINHPYLPHDQVWTCLYIAVNWAANFLPWMLVSRCIFLYHYMTGVVFAIMATGWLCDRFFSSRKISLTIIAIAIIILVVIAFIYWLPVYLGLPLSPTSWKWRMWLNSWI